MLSEINTLKAPSPNKHVYMPITWKTRCAQICSERCELEETLILLSEIEPVFVRRAAILLSAITTPEPLECKVV
jgi:hypothetical protein